jgi:hypothetical protein
VNLEEQKLRLLQLHKEFLDFPQTHVVLAKLEAFRVKLLCQAETLALDDSTVSKARMKLIESNNIKRILSHIKDAEKFVNELNNN